MNTVTLDSLRLVGMRLLCGLCVITAACVLVIFVSGIAATDPVVPALAAAFTIYPIVLAVRGGTGAADRIAMSVSVSAMPAFLLYALRDHVWQTDIHMVFFAALATIFVLCDWRAILAGTIVVALHHLILGMIVPGWVFYGAAESEVGRVLLHAVILVVEAGVLMAVARHIVTLLATIGAQNEARQQAETAIAAERDARNAVMQSVIDSMGQSLAAVSSGDLTAGIAMPYPVELQRLRSDFNDALDNLRGMVGAVRDSANGIRVGTGEIAQASDDLAERTQGNAANLEETSAALCQIDQRVRATASTAERTGERAGQATVAVSGGRRTAEEAVAAMGRVASSAQGIDSVMEGLDRIAFQTRVLAMNATVEAGRAGDAGRAFAVVADLVSALAIRAEDEAQRAREQITTTRSDIAVAVEAVQRVDAALADISCDVGVVHELINSVVFENSLQSAAITQITASIATMDSATQQNAAMVEQTSAAAQSLMSEVTALSNRAAMFRIERSDAAGDSGRERKAA
jgi:methyl-accepting chemotaxis protein